MHSLMLNYNFFKIMEACIILTDILLYSTIILDIIIFLGIIVGVNLVKHKILSYTTVQYNPDRIIPVEELRTLKQLSYLIFSTILLMDVISLLYFSIGDIVELIYIDTFISLIVCTVLYDEDISKLLFAGLMPLGTIIATIFLFFNNDFTISLVYPLIIVLEVIHIIVDIYFSWYFYEKFNKYTRDKRLGYTVVVLFIIILVSFIITLIFEKGGVLDALVMVSNAFTSNGYSVLGTSLIGKLTSLILVWGGYFLSGVGTATLTYALLRKRLDKRINLLEEKISKQDETNKKLIKEISKQNKILEEKR